MSILNFQQGNSAAATSHTISVPLAEGTNRRVVVMWTCDISTTLSSPTWDGNAMSVAGGLANGIPQVRAYEYSVPDNKAAGNYNIAIASSASAAVTYAYWNASQITGSVTAGTGTASTATTMTATLTAPSNATLLCGGLIRNNAVTITTTGAVTDRSPQPTPGNHSARYADATGVASGSRSATQTWTGADTGAILLLAYEELQGPTITTQPTALTRVLTNSRTATFTAAATSSGGTLLRQWQLETSVGSGTYANVADGSGLTFSGNTTDTLTVTLANKTASGRRLRCRYTDDNGSTDTNAVALTIFDGPQLTAFAPTNGSGVTTATLTCDYVTGTGEAIEVRVLLPDGSLAVSTVVT